MSKTARTVIRELSDLCDAARSLTRKAEDSQMRATASQVRGIAYNLDAARTRLVEEGESYMAVAQAFVAAATEYLPAHAAHIGRARRDPERPPIPTATCERLCGEGVCIAAVESECSA